MPPLLRQRTPPRRVPDSSQGEDRRVSKSRCRRRKRKEEEGAKMGQALSAKLDRRQRSLLARASSSKLYRHHLDPVSLSRQTVEVREHMFGESDVVVSVKGERFPVHKDVLSEHSGFFKAMFGAFSEREQEEVELKDLVEPGLMAQVKTPPCLVTLD